MSTVCTVSTVKLSNFTGTVVFRLETSQGFELQTVRFGTDEILHPLNVSSPQPMLCTILHNLNTKSIKISLCTAD